MTKLYTFCKAFHRVLVLVMLTIGLCMVLTGLLMKYPQLNESLLPFFKPALVRFLHNSLSIYFSIVLLLMMLTGAWMYLYPFLMRHRARKTPPSSPPSAPTPTPPVP